MSYALAALLVAVASAAPLDAFLEPIVGKYAANSDIVPFVEVSNVTTCASRCIATPGCVSFNLCDAGKPSVYNCGVSAYSMAYDVTSGAACSLYTKIQPRNDSPVVAVVPWSETRPLPHTVELRTEGLLGAAFQSHHDTYLVVRSPLDMLYFFYKRALKTPPNGSECFGKCGFE